MFKEVKMIKSYIHFVGNLSEKIMTCHMADPLPCNRGDSIKLNDQTYFIHHVDWEFKKITGNQHLSQTVIVGTNPPPA
jgi:hypothetical protein